VGINNILGYVESKSPKVLAFLIVKRLLSELDYYEKR